MLEEARVQYYDTVQKAVDFIEKHLKDEISLYDIAEHVNFSVPHIYRIFKAVVGESVKSYTIRRRLECAAVDLKASKRNISEIAYEYGFESHDVFTRAFSRAYNISPSRFRISDIEVGFEMFSGYKNIDVLERSICMDYKVINKNRVTVIGMECEAKQWDADGAVGRLWSSFLENADKVKNPAVPNIMYGICEHENCDQSDSFIYMAGIEADENCDVPAGMIKRILRQQKYLEAEVPQDVITQDAYTKAFEFARQNGYSLDEYDVIEVYEEVFKDPYDHAFKLLIPIK